MSDDKRMDIIEAMQDKYGEAPINGFPTNPLDYRYYMIVGIVHTSQPHAGRVYYEWSDDLDELYEQAGNIIHDNTIDLSYGVLAHPVAIVDTITGNILAPVLPSMIQFRQTTETITL